MGQINTEAIAMKVQSAGLFTGTMKRKTKLGSMAGTFPQQKDAEAHLRNQSSSDMPIVRCKDLQRTAGEEVTIDLVNPLSGLPVMGSENAEGTGEAITFSQDKLRINQMRKTVSAGDTMTQQRTNHELKGLSTAALQGYMDKIEDELEYFHIAGARGTFKNAEMIMPLATHEKFNKICVNKIKAPTFNRHYLATSDGIEQFTASSNVVDLASTSLFKMDTVDALRQLIDDMAFAPAPIKVAGDVLAQDEPIHLLCVSPAQYMNFKKSSSNAFRTFQAEAHARASNAKQHPLFLGEVALWEGIMLMKMPFPIRFSPGDAIYHCTSNTDATEVTTDLVDADLGSNYAVERAVLLGAQALAEAYGKHRKSGSPYYSSEAELDHGDKLEICLASIGGKSKIRFVYDMGDDGMQPTDQGALVIDTVVKLVK